MHPVQSLLPENSLQDKGILFHMFSQELVKTKIIHDSLESAFKKQPPKTPGGNALVKKVATPPSSSSSGSSSGPQQFTHSFVKILFFFWKIKKSNSKNYF